MVLAILKLAYNVLDNIMGFFKLLYFSKYFLFLSHVSVYLPISSCTLSLSVFSFPYHMYYFVFSLILVDTYFVVFNF